MAGVVATIKDGLWHVLWVFISPDLAARFKYVVFKRRFCSVSRFNPCFPEITPKQALPAAVDQTSAASLLV